MAKPKRRIFPHADKGQNLEAAIAHTHKQYAGTFAKLAKEEQESKSK